MSQSEHPFTVFSQSLEQAGMAKGSDKITVGDRIIREAEKENRIKTVPEKKAPASAMTLPSVLVEEGAKMVFSHWERIAARDQGVEPLPWEQLEESYRQEWRSIVSVVLEMGISVILRDAITVIDHSNGDMGGAYAKALRRYMRERLNVM